jgi:hypothetical protein
MGSVIRLSYSGDIKATAMLAGLGDLVGGAPYFAFSRGRRIPDGLRITVTVMMNPLIRQQRRPSLFTVD